MTYRLPMRTTTSCTSSGCDTTVSYDDGDPGTRVRAVAGWTFGPGSATCPSHPARPSVLDFAAG